MNSQALEVQTLKVLKAELETELGAILGYWTRNTPDREHGGFTGRIQEDGQPDTESDKGSVLNARILWSYAAAFNLTGDGIYLEEAERACKYILDFFIDQTYGGVYWSVDSGGRKKDAKKQVYAIAFTIYGLTEYYKACKKKSVLDTAINLYHTLVEKSYDTEYSGYFEAFSEDWSPLADMRLSAKDANEQKSMNTHLHVLEACTSLYSCWPDPGLKVQLVSLLGNFSRFIIDTGTHTQILFFDAAWNSRSAIVSYGHDIESSWLLLEAAVIIGEPELITSYNRIALELAEKAMAGLDSDGGLWYESDGEHLVREKHWWVQAEALVGFFNAWEISGNHAFLEAALGSWEFIKARILDKVQGEWFWGIGEDGKIMPGQDKVGFWKCPYHNSRACMELIRRISMNPYFR